MSTYTRRRPNPQGKTNLNTFSQTQRGEEPVRRASQFNQLFPSKPVAHRRPNNQKSHDSHHEFDFEKITITKQPRATWSQEHHSNGKEASESQNPQRKSKKLVRGELEMSRAIQAEQVMLQGKLWRLDAKVRQKIQRDTDGGVGRSCTKKGETHTESKLSEQQKRESVRHRDGQEDVKQQMKRRDQRMEDRMRNIHEDKKTTWREDSLEEETEYIQRKGCGGTQKNKSRLEDVTDHSRGKGEYEEGGGSWRNRGAAEEKEQSSVLQGDKGWSRERRNREMHESDRNQQITQHKTYQAATKNYRGAGGKDSQEPLYPPGSISPHPSRQEQEELICADRASHSLQLLPCKVCSRKFTRERLEKHVLICERVKRTSRPVFNTFANRTKGTSLGEYLKTHSRATTPEIVKKKKQRQSSVANTRNTHEVRPPAGTSNLKKI